MDLDSCVVSMYFGFVKLAFGWRCVRTDCGGLARAPAFVVAMKRCDFIDKAPQRAQEASERE